ncbi:MAG: hypothetical protein J6S83_13240 [Lachnospiraceae bacterium]|nr:hypothetical protein [Lachnospiraceae bacterium]
MTDMMKMNEQEVKAVSGGTYEEGLPYAEQLMEKYGTRDPIILFTRMTAEELHEYSRLVRHES